MQLIDEHDDVGIVRELLHDRLEALFELPAVLRAGNNQGDIERQDALVRQEMRNIAVDDLLRKPLDDGRLADTRFADQHGVVLRPAAEHLLYTLELVVAAHQRIELVLHRRLGQVPAEFRQQWRLLDPRERRLFVQQLHDVFADLMEAHPLFHQDGGGYRPLFTQDAKQKVLGANVVVQQPIRFFSRKLQHTLGFGTERNLHRGGNLFAEDGSSFDFFADVFEREVGTRENPAGQTLAFPD